jgi:hypothetical protein
MAKRSFAGDYVCRNHKHRIRMKLQRECGWWISNVGLEDRGGAKRTEPSPPVVANPLNHSHAVRREVKFYRWHACLTF